MPKAALARPLPTCQTRKKGRLNFLYPALTARVPAVVLWGDRDPYISRRYAERFGARAVRHFGHLGHWTQLEAPHDVARELLAFFSDASPADREK